MTDAGPLNFTHNNVWNEVATGEYTESVQKDNEFKRNLLKLRDHNEINHSFRRSSFQIII